MTDQTTCPHCGADASCCVLGQTYYRCGSFSHSTACVQSMTCELTELRAKVAAQQELLKEAADALRLLNHWSDEATHLGHATLNACHENAAEVLRKLE